MFELFNGKVVIQVHVMLLIFFQEAVLEEFTESEERTANDEDELPMGVCRDF